MPFETLNVRIPHRQKRQLERHAALLEVTPSELVRRLLDAAADRFQPAAIDLDDAAPISIDIDNAEGRGLVRELLRLRGPEPRARGGDSVNKSDPIAVAAHLCTELFTCETVRKSARDGQTSLKDVALGQLKDEQRRAILNDPLADSALVRASVLKSARGKALYGLSRLLYSGLPFEEAIDSIERQFPGHITEDFSTFAAPGDVAPEDRAALEAAKPPTTSHPPVPVAPAPDSFEDFPKALDDETDDLPS